MNIEIKVTDQQLFDRVVNSVNTESLKGYEDSTIYGDVSIILEPTTPTGRRRHYIEASGEFSQKDYETEFGFIFVN